MIFEEVVLHNFGVYQGRHEVPLSVSPTKPIVLVGAMNGSGKTTFLDALQLALYGKSARCTGRERVSYPDYLESMINRGVSPSQGAGVEFAFRTRSNGQDSLIRVVRTWSVHGQGVRENLEVLRDGIVDSVASERWQEFVEDFMPSQIADLFFFDGEKIEALADPTKSAGLLRVGIHSLLGIDLVESLVKSLQQIERKRKVSNMTDSDRSKMEDLQRRHGELQETCALVRQRAGKYTTDIDAAKRVMELASLEFKRLGGDLIDRRDQFLQEKAALIGRKKNLEEELRHIASGVLPLALADDVIQLALGKARESLTARDVGVLLVEAQKRDKALVAFMRSAKIKQDAVDMVAEYLDVDRSKRYRKDDQVLGLPATVLEQYRPEEMARSKKRAQNLLKELDDTNERLVAVERNLSAVPEQAVIADAQRRLEKCRTDVLGLEALLTVTQSELSEVEGKLERLNREIDQENTNLREIVLKDEVAARVSLHSARARDTLGKFRDRLLAENLQRLQGSISACFQRLLRKKSLLGGVAISPTTFELSLIHPTGVAVSAHRLSAGERQLLAVATLWALSQASGRHLPAVIDTPLSRLDSLHRGTIVQNYFPAASHQVILLSTDEEVVGRYYRLLQPYVAREYIVEHDDAMNTSSFRDGYFMTRPELEEKAA